MARAPQVESGTRCPAVLLPTGLSGEVEMPTKSQTMSQRALEQEPIGIVISRGQDTELPPRFSMYVYGSADEPLDEAVEVQTA